MITQNATTTIQCQTQAEYDQAKAFVQQADIGQVQITYADTLLRITITATQQVARLG